jgi:hypothetical protein
MISHAYEGADDIIIAAAAPLLIHNNIIHRTGDQ